jgi:uracil-DNA glycosylase
MIDQNGPRNPRSKLGRLAREVRACTVCATHLPLGPRPVLRVDERVRVLITGQAPGTRVHATGLPWNDPSGERLRQWLQVDRENFYDLDRFGVMAMGFCYPGKGKGGDLPPRPECAPLWHAQLRALMPQLRLTLLVGRYAQLHYLDTRSETLADTVQRWRDFLPLGYFPLPHPSPRNTRWLRARPWFEQEVLPGLRAAVGTALDHSADSP